MIFVFDSWSRLSAASEPHRLPASPSVCLSIQCPTVCLTVTFRHCVTPARDIVLNTSIARQTNHSGFLATKKKRDDSDTVYVR